MADTKPIPAGITMEKEQQKERILSHPKPLSPTQRRAVLSDTRHIRIIAGASASKTETLTRRIVYHLIYEETDPAAKVAFTFTDKAAQGMKSRIYNRLKDMGRDDLQVEGLLRFNGLGKVGFIFYTLINIS
jgi:DNA helicase-2/ATP-dependent DNA helicase PcrA